MERLKYNERPGQGQKISSEEAGAGAGAGGRALNQTMPTAPVSGFLISRPEKDFHDALLTGSLHGIDTTPKGILFADQAVDVDGAFL